MANKETVVVTGCAGFIGSHLTERLLQAGYHVRGTVRNARNVSKYGHLHAMPHAAERLTLHDADLLNEGSFDNCIRGCDMVFHVASPFQLDVKDVKRDLIDPAIQGTMNVLRSCVKMGVRRVVMTSSIAAVTESGVPLSEGAHRFFNENDWNEKSSPKRNPYYYSKSAAEKSASQYIEDLRQRGHAVPELIVINPVLVWGPSHIHSVNQSVQIIDFILKGDFPGILNFHFAVIDVRDVADALIQVMENKTVEPGRYLLSNRTISMREVVDVIRYHFPNFKTLPSLNLENMLGDVAVKAASVLREKGLAQWLRGNVGMIVRVDSKKSWPLDFKFLPTDRTIVETVQNMIDMGFVKYDTRQDSNIPSRL